jgi:hypothetical protein
MGASDIEHLHQLAVHAYYVGEHDVGLRACERLLGEQLSPERESVVRRNRTWYARRLEELADCRHQRIDVPPAHPGWTLFNPSIVARGGGYDLLVRSSNYRIADGRYGTPAEDAGRIRTENVLASLDADLRVVGEPRVIHCEYPRSDYPVDGLEDCRLNYHGLCSNGLGTTISATVRNWGGLDGNARIATADLPGFVARPTLLPEPRPGRHEKNWMPLVGTHEYVYSCHEDGHVVVAREQDGRWVLEPRGTSPAIARGWRGGSQLIACDEGWVALIHEVADDDGRRVYEHRFVWFDDGLNVVGYTRPFAFREPRTIEFAAGLAWHGDDRLVCTYGVRDEEAWMTSVDYCDIVTHWTHA